MTSDIWRLADSLGPVRLSVLMVFSVAAMVVWLIVDHELWERPAGRVAREQAVLYNVATALTVALGVGSLYVALSVLILAGGSFVITGDLLRQSLRHPVGWSDYATVAWLATSMATIGGALGSGLGSDAAVRKAAYGYRQKERRDLEAPGDGTDG